MADPYLLDTSAVLTLIEDEAGADRVEELLRHHTVLHMLQGQLRLEALPYKTASR